MSPYAFFWGCTIPARFPFMESSIRSILNMLGVDYCDLEGFTCCPEKTLVKNHNSGVWETVAGRNLAVAEEAGRDLLSACTGCYSTLKSVSSRLRTYPSEMALVNDRLEPIGLKFAGTSRVRHLVELLHDQVGMRKIGENIISPLSGMRIAVHGGCHLVRPSNAIHFDDPIKPVKYDRVVEALGAESVDSSTKMLCCGGYLSRAGMQDPNLAMAAVKLKELTELGVDALTTTCPECFKVYDNFQPFIQKKGERVNVPVLTLTELMGLAFGLTAQELGISEHRIDCSPFLEKFEAIKTGVRI